MSNDAEKSDNGRVSAIISAMKNAFLDKTLADVVIKIHSVELRTHSFILAAQSEYFATALKDEFQEGHDRVFEFKEGSMQAHWRVFEYMYTGKYSDEPPAEMNTPDDDELLKDVRVYQLAEYFGAHGLSDYALGKFKVKVEKLWVSENFVSCIREVYSSTVYTQCKMRATVVEIIRKHLDVLWKRPLQDLLREGGDFPVDLLDETVCNDAASF